MTDLSSVPDDVLLAELHARRGRFSPDEYMSPDQSDDRAKLGILRSRIVEGKLACFAQDDMTSVGFHVVLGLSMLCDKLDSISGNPLPARAFPLNTTLPGRESEFQP